MNVLQIITGGDRGGAQTHVKELASYLVRLGHTVHVVAGTDGSMMSALREQGVPVTVMPELVVQPHALLDLRAVQKIYRLIRAMRPSIVHCHSSKAGVLGRLAAALAQVPSVFTAHGWSFTPGTPMARRLMAIPIEWTMAKTCAVIIAVSQFDFGIAQKYRINPKCKMMVIPNGLTDFPLPVVEGRRSGYSVVMVARFAVPKQQTALLYAFREVLAVVGRRSRLLLVGDGPGLPAAMELARRLDVYEHVLFLGDRSDVRNILRESDVFVLASSYEGLPVSILEAMWAGLPVIATNVGGIGELVEHGVTGYLVGSGDSEDIARRLIFLFRHPEERRKMGALGRARFDEAYEMDSVGKRIVEAYVTATETRCGKS